MTKCEGVMAWLEMEYNPVDGKIHTILRVLLVDIL